MVEVGGIAPPSKKVTQLLLQACSILGFSSLAIKQTKHQRLCSQWFRKFASKRYKLPTPRWLTPLFQR